MNYIRKRGLSLLLAVAMAVPMLAFPAQAATPLSISVAEDGAVSVTGTSNPIAYDIRANDGGTDLSDTSSITASSYDYSAGIVIGNGNLDNATKADGTPVESINDLIIAKADGTNGYIVIAWDKTDIANTVATYAFYYDNGKFKPVPKSITALTKTADPTETSYKSGGELDLAGLGVQIDYDDSSNETLIYGPATAEKMNSLLTFKIGTDAVADGDELTVTGHDGKAIDIYATADLDEDGNEVSVTHISTSALTVAKKSLSSITVKTPPTKTTYQKDDSGASTAVALAGLVITATWDNSKTTDVTYSASAGITASTIDTTSIGSKSTTITYTPTADDETNATPQTVAQALTVSAGKPVTVASTVTPTDNVETYTTIPATLADLETDADALATMFGLKVTDDGDSNKDITNQGTWGFTAGSTAVVPGLNTINLTWTLATYAPGATDVTLYVKKELSMSDFTTSTITKGYDNTTALPAALGANDVALTTPVETGSGPATPHPLTVTVAGHYNDKNVLGANGSTITVTGVTVADVGGATDSAWADYYVLPTSGSITDATITQATTVSLAFDPTTLSQVKGGIHNPTVTSNPASDDLAAVVEFEVPVAAVITVTAASCDCGAVEKSAHDFGCPVVACTCGAVAGTPAATMHAADCDYTTGLNSSACTCVLALAPGHENEAHKGNSVCPVVDCTCSDIAPGVAIGFKHETGCAYGGNSVDHAQVCNCSVRTSSTLNNVSDHADPCDAVVTTPATTEWKQITETPTDSATLGADVQTWLNSLPENTVVNVRAYSNASTNLSAVAVGSAVTGTLTITAPAPMPSPSTGGSDSSGYTVRYDAGEHGKLASGSRSSESVDRNKSPKKVPTVVADEGWEFIGWTLDGKTVDPTELKITKGIKLVASYKEINKEVPSPELAFNKNIVEPYIQGIEENGALVFKPDADMSRAEVAAIIARTLTVKMEEGKSYYDGQFSDVSANDWYADYVGFLNGLGVIKGYDDGTFKAEAPITRAEFVAMVMRVEGVVTGDSRFTDVESDYWAAELIASANAKGVVKGYEDNTFRPTNPITRAEAVTIVNRILGWLDELNADMKFTDVDESYWAYDAILNASTAHAAE